AVDDFVREPPGEGAGAAAGDGTERRRGVAHDALGERATTRIDDLDRVVGVEVALDVAHARGEERPVVGAQGAPGAVVDDDAPGGTERKRDPELSTRKSLG